MEGEFLKHLRRFFLRKCFIFLTRLGYNGHQARKLSLLFCCVDQEMLVSKDQYTLFQEKSFRVPDEVLLGQEKSRVQCPKMSTEFWTVQVPQPRLPPEDAIAALGFPRIHPQGNHSEPGLFTSFLNPRHSEESAPLPSLVFQGLFVSGWILRTDCKFFLLQLKSTQSSCAIDTTLFKPGA